MTTLTTAHMYVALTLAYGLLPEMGMSRLRMLWVLTISSKFEVYTSFLSALNAGFMETTPFHKLITRIIAVGYKLM